MPFEFATGLAEKIQPLVRFPILMRVVLPGFLATVIIYPFTGWRTDLLTANLEEVWRQLVLAFGIMPFVLGALLSALGDQIYKIYEGRILWPGFLFNWLRGWQARRVRALFKKADKASKGEGTLQYDEVWYKLRMYPLDDKGEPHASHPTLLGNILAGYEDYPKTRYEMDSVFFWPRLWLEMDKDKKQEIDATWSVADGFLSLSVVSLSGGVLWVAAAVAKNLPVPLAYPTFGTSLTWALSGIFLMLLGYSLYRLSLPFHRRNGEIFKAIFDLYRDKISVITNFGPADSTTWRGTWSYLQYLSVYCVRCHNYFPANLEQCQFCQFPAAKSLKELRRLPGPHAPAGGQPGN